MRVLVIDDDPALLANVEEWLTRAGLVVQVAATAHEGMSAASTRWFDVVVLDVMLGPGDDGVDVCRLLRRAGIGTPVLMLTARDAVPDRVLGLDAGADDYLVKPFALEELEARIRALVRRHLADRSAVLRFGDVELDTAGRCATTAGSALRLTEKELRLLEYLLLERGVPRAQSEIVSRVWGYAEAPADNLVDVYAARLRRKLEAAGSGVTVVSRKRQGYLLAVRPDAVPGAGR